MALVNGGFLHYTDMKKYLKNLLRRNRRSDFRKLFYRNQGLTLANNARSGVIARGKLPSPFVNPKGKVKVFGLLSSVRVFIADTSSFWSFRSDKQMDIKLFTEFLKKMIYQKTWLLWKTHFPLMVQSKILESTLITSL